MLNWDPRLSRCWGCWMSKLSDEVYDKFKKWYPHFTIRKEHYVNYKGSRLFFDFFVKELNLLVECQGEQHYKFNKHFHGDRAAFLDSKARDNLKIEYAEEYRMALMTIRYDDKIEYGLMQSNIMKAILKVKLL